MSWPPPSPPTHLPLPSFCSNLLSTPTLVLCSGNTPKSFPTWGSLLFLFLLHITVLHMISLLSFMSLFKYHLLKKDVLSSLRQLCFPSAEISLVSFLYLPSAEIVLVVSTLFPILLLECGNFNVSHIRCRCLFHPFIYSI